MSCNEGMYSDVSGALSFIGEQVERKHEDPFGVAYATS